MGQAIMMLHLNVAPLYKGLATPPRGRPGRLVAFLGKWRVP